MMFYMPASKATKPTKHADEAGILALLKLGDTAAVKLWYDEYAPDVARFISAKIDQPADVEELTQEVFMNALRQLPLFRGGSSLLTWMLSIASHEVADYYRKKYAKKALKTFPLGEMLVKDDIKDIEYTTEKVKQVLQTMTPKYRALVMAKYVDMLSVQEIAGQLQRSIKAVESDLFRARQEFKALYIAVE
jgi:RNA polymerase sigma-70 factor (ECF subfamily)